MITGLAVAWGLVVGASWVVVAHAAKPGRLGSFVRIRSVDAAPPGGTDVRPRRLLPGRSVVERLRARRVNRAREAERTRDLPILVEVLGVAIAAGSTPLLALEQSRRWVPPSCGAPIDGVLGAHRLGAPFPAALGRGFGSLDAFAPLVDALSATERLGMAVGPELARVATDCREAQRRAAEQRARSMSIRLLFPLVFLVLPAFGLLTVVPVLVAGLHRL